MLLILLAAIFIRPFISSTAFPFLSDIITTLILFFLCIFVVCRKPCFSKTPAVSLSITFFCLAIVVSLFFSQDKNNSLYEAYKYVIGLLLMLTASSFSKEENAQAVKVIVLSGAVIGLLALYQYFFGFNNLLRYISDNNAGSPFILDYISRKRVFSPFITPGILGGYLAMLLPLVFSDKKYLFLLVLIIPALFLTKSIAAFISLIFVLLVYIFISKKIKKTIIWWFLGVLLLGIIIFIQRCLVQKEYLQPVFSFTARLKYWQQALGLVNLNPLVGIGLGNFNLANSRYAHNVYLQLWVETGILGLTSFIMLVSAVFKHCFGNKPELLDNRQALCLVASAVIFLIHNFFDFSFFLPEVAFVWWFIMGLIYSCRRINI